MSAVDWYKYEFGDGVVRMKAAATTNITCPCGFSGPDCLDTIEGRQISSFPGGVCGDGQDDRTFGCFLTSDGAAKCSCAWGWQGAICNEPQTLQMPILAVSGIVLPALGMILAYILYRKRFLARCFKHKHLEAQDLGESRMSAKLLLVFRLCMFGFLAFVTVYEVLRLDTTERIWFHLRFFTHVVFLLTVLYSVVAMIESIRYVRKGRSNQQEVDDGREEPNFLERFGSGLLVVCLPSQFVVTGLTWIVLYPMALDEGKEFTVLHFASFVMHGGILMLLLVDYLLCGVRISAHQYVYVLMFGSSYLVWHSAIMFLEYYNGLPHRPAYPFLSSSSYVYMAWPCFLIASLLLVAHVLLCVLDRLVKPKFTSPSPTIAASDLALGNKL